MAVIWSALEVQVAMITVCFPALRRLLAHFFPQLMSTTVSPTTNGTIDTKPRSNHKIWHPPGSFGAGTNGTSTAVASSHDKNEDFELRDNVVKVEGTFYVSSTSLKNTNSRDSDDEPLVLQGPIKYNVTPELPIQRHEEDWRRRDHRF